MINFKNGKIDVDVLEITDIIDKKLLQDFLDNFAISANCAAIAVDRKGEEITRPSHYRDFCNKYIHASSIGDRRCAECHNAMGVKAKANGKPFIGKCHAGLIDFAVPIVIEGVQLGTVLGGQVLNQPPIESEIRQVAREIKVSEDELWSAAGRIDIISQKNIDATAEVLSTVVNTLAQDGYNRIKMGQISGDFADNFINISSTIEQLTATAEDITTSQHTLNTEITEIEQFTKEINTILQRITTVANKVKLVGLNATIESARFGHEGAGFAVVAKEIQKLADDTRQTVISINDLNTKINEKIMTTTSNADNVLQIVEEQSSAMVNLSDTLQTSLKLAETLKALYATK